MPPAFVPFFEKPSSAEAQPQYQFNQFRISKVTVAQTIPPSPKRLHVDKHEIQSKLLGDLKSALCLSLPEEAVQQILANLDKQREPEHLALADAPIEEGAETSGKPNVKLEKDGDKITNIIVECDCGQVIALDCVY